MRATVGPLPSAVYWRRRAVVLGAVLLGIIVLFVSCTGDDKKDQRNGAPSSQSQSPTPGPGGSAPETEPSFLDNQPNNGGPSLPAPDEVESEQPGGTGGNPNATALPTLGSGQNTNVTAPADGSCSDQEISLTATPATTSVKRGATLEIGLKIKNVGSRTCSRDVGADPQELYIDQAARKYWSSDTCSTDKSSNVRKLKPGEELNYRVTWNGRQSSSCAGNVASGPNPPPGQFQLRARLGTLLSNPAVDLTIAA